ncbi:glutamate ABC transporter substrate-binding protein [Streptomyces sp. ISL-99]|uniref:glutamate ABC transporter substrate-binding protein n=1 Tax=Streptomyces sp. ISL-99 TaxID=2819193 RepID=UPI001BEB4FDB|nr:glutamate ABC transporter substrate-binding protein [Streptomyces sp. ISL-99]MBT2527185.1 glutamate ABC transporter substrate-binding protein [Streptomyces sp. ISL-99]
MREMREMRAEGGAVTRSGSRYGGTGSRLRGWGGVAGMAAACALTAAVTLLPISHGAGAGQDPDAAGQGVTRAVATRADTCEDPEASLRPSGAEGPAIEKIKARGKLIAGVDQNSFRWGYRNPATRDLEGFDIDLVRAVAEDILGDPDKVIYRAIPTNQRILALQEGRVDVVVRTMTVTCARIKDVAFSTAYFQAGQQVLAPKESTVKGYDASLAGKKVCTAKGSTAYDALAAKSFGARFEGLTVSNQLDCLVRLQLGEVDAVVTDNALAAGQAAQDPAVELKGEPFTQEYYGIATKLGSDDLVRRLNQVLDDYREGGDDGPWMKAYGKWLKEDLPGIKKPPEPKYRDN